MKRVWDFENHGDSIAITGMNGETLTYTELSSLSGSLFGSDKSPGLVLILCANTIGAIASYAAALSASHPVMLLSSELFHDQIKHVLKTYRPSFLLLPGKLSRDYPHMKILGQCFDYTLLLTNYPSADINPELAVMLSTSGSTSSVKFVRLSCENVQFNAQILADALGISSSDRLLTMLPMHYTYGLSMINCHLLKGASIYCTDLGIMDAEFWDILEDKRITSFHGVSGAYDMMSRLGFLEEELPHVRLMTQAGGKLGTAMQEELAGYAGRYGKEFVIMYGQTEATAAISILSSEYTPKKPGSAGQCVPGSRLKLVASDGQEIKKPFERGELVYEGRNVALGYATCLEDLAKGDEFNGTLRTGDEAERDEEGFYYITGRLKRIIKVAGHRISLDEIDSMILDELNVPSASIGKDDELLILVTEAEQQSVVEKFVRAKIPVTGTVLRTLVIDEFPVNDGGKILYGKLAEEYL